MFSEGEVGSQSAPQKETRSKKQQRYALILDAYLLRAYICLKRIKTNFPVVENEQQLAAKSKMQELEVKLLKLIYVCLVSLQDGEPNSYQAENGEARSTFEGLNWK